MKALTLSLTLLLVGSCANNQKAINKAQIERQGKAFTSPNQKVDATILIERTEESFPDSSVTRGVLKVGSIVPQHVHADSDEYLIFSQGAGELTIEESSYKVKSGDAIFIPRGTKHSYVNRGSKDAHFIQIYTPSGPEQRFKKWSKR